MTELTTVTSLTNFRATLLNKDTLPTEWPVGQDLVLALEFESDEIAQGQDLDISKLDLSTPLSTVKFVRSVDGEETLEETTENNKTVVYAVLTPTEEGTETSFTFTYYDADNNITSHAGVGGVNVTYKNKIEGDYSVVGLNVAPDGGDYTIEPVMSASHDDVRFVAEVEGERRPFTGKLTLATPNYHGKSEITVTISAKADKRGKNYRKFATKEFIIDTTGAWHLKGDESTSSVKPVTKQEMDTHFDTLFSKMTNENGGNITVNEGESFTIGVTPLNAEGYSYENLRYRVNHDGHPVSEGTTYTHTATTLDDAGTWEINIENETESGVSHSVTWNVSVTPKPVSKQPINGPEITSHFDELFDLVGFADNETKEVRSGDRVLFGVTKRASKLDTHDYSEVRFKITHNDNPVSTESNHTFTADESKNGTWKVIVYNVREGDEHGKAITLNVTVQSEPAGKPQVTNEDIVDRFDDFFAMSGFTVNSTETVNEGESFHFAITKLKEDTHDYSNVNMTLNHSMNSLGSVSEYTIGAATQGDAGEYEFHVYVNDNTEAGAHKRFMLEVTPKTNDEEEEEETVAKPIDNSILSNEQEFLKAFEPLHENGSTQAVNPGDNITFGVSERDSATYDYSGVTYEIYHNGSKIATTPSYLVLAATSESAGTWEVKIIKDDAEKVLTYTLSVAQPPAEEDSTEDHGTEDDREEGTDDSSSDGRVEPPSVDSGLSTGNDTDEEASDEDTSDEAVSLSQTNLGIVHEGDQIDIIASNTKEDAQLQWYHISKTGERVAIEGQTTNRLTVRASLDYNNKFVLHSTRGIEMVDSPEAVITRFVSNAPAVSWQNHRAGDTVTADERTSLTLEVSVTPNDKHTTINWYHQPADGSRDAEHQSQYDGLTTIDLNPLALADAGVWSVRVMRGEHTSESGNITLVVNEVQEAVKVDIRLSKEGLINEPVNGTFTIHAEVTNYNESMLLQWYHTRGDVTELVAGANAQVLMIPNLTVGHSGHYFLRVTQAGNITTSDAVQLNVVEAPSTEDPEVLEPKTEEGLTDEERLRARKYPDGVGIFAISVDNYCQAMYQGKQVNPKDGARHQVVFYRDIIRILELDDIDTYMYAMDMLVDHFWAYRETVFRMEQRFRFLEFIGNDYMSKDDKEAFVALVTVFVTMADPVNNVAISLNEVADILNNDLAFSRLSEYYDRKVRTQKQAIIQASGL